MASLFDQVEAKIDANPRLTKPGTARFDMTLLMFNARADVRALWLAADAVAAGDDPALDELRVAVDALRPIFGARA